jgi:hypothetical protein
MIKVMLLSSLLISLPSYAQTWRLNAMTMDINAPAGKLGNEIENRKLSNEQVDFTFSGVKCSISKVDKNVPTLRNLKCNLANYEVGIQASCSGEGMSTLDFKPKGQYNQRVVILCQ